MKRSLVLMLLVIGCGASSGDSHDGSVDYGVTCPNPPTDTDGDGIADRDEGSEERPPRDTDRDGTPDYQDQDSDNDGIPDAVEGRNGNPCTPPVDSDGDKKPDFQDLDSDSPADDTVADAEEAGFDPLHPTDTNHDGRPDYMDADNDGDHIPDRVELTAQGQLGPALHLNAAPDTDHDGTPDFLDIDSDGDTISDLAEGMVDTDGDLIPNYRDLDSDGDCVPDLEEAGAPLASNAPVDTDQDGTPDFEDRDSDNDGLIDGAEDANCNGKVDGCETSRVKTDTDGDGVPDLIEVEDCLAKPPAVQTATNCVCDASSASNSPLTRGDFVFVVDYMKTPVPQSATLSLSSDVSQADVIFSLDTTGSMLACLTNLASNLATIVPKIEAAVKNVAFGVLEFKDFSDRFTTEPFVVRYDERIQTVNSAPGLAVAQSALNALMASDGGDSPEAGWEALYSIAGGPAINLTTPSLYNSVLPLMSTPQNPPTAGEVQGTVGGAGFRPGSIPIVVTVSDAEWHDAPGSAVVSDPESGLNAYVLGFMGGTPPSRRQAITQLQSIGAHVIGLAALGLHSSGDPKSRMRATAQETGAVVTPADFGPVGVRPAGCGATSCCTGLAGAGEPSLAGTCPLSYSVNGNDGSGVSDSVVSGIAALARGLLFDIHVAASDIDAGTVSNFILKLQPNLSGTGPAAMCVSMTLSPLQDNFTGPFALPGPDGTVDTLPGIGGGKQVCFDVVPRTNTAIMNSGTPQIYRAQLQVKGVAGGNSFDLGTPRQVFFLVPPVIENGPIK